MRLIDRIMTATGRRLAGGKVNRPSPLRKRRRYVELSEDAMSVIQGIAEETDLTPSEVLKNSVTLYKMALASRKAEASQSPSVTA